MPYINDKKQNKLKIIAKTVNFHPCDLHCDYEDGTFEWFDSSELRKTEPSEHSSKRLYIYHNESPEKNSIWLQKRVIVELKFKGDKNELLKSFFKNFIFGDGIELKKNISD